MIHQKNIYIQPLGLQGLCLGSGGVQELWECWDVARWDGAADPNLLTRQKQLQKPKACTCWAALEGTQPVLSSSGHLPWA